MRCVKHSHSLHVVYLKDTYVQSYKIIFFSIIYLEYTHNNHVDLRWWFVQVYFIFIWVPMLNFSMKCSYYGFFKIFMGHIILKQSQTIQMCVVHIIRLIKYIIWISVSTNVLKTMKNNDWLYFFLCVYKDIKIILNKYNIYIRVFLVLLLFFLNFNWTVIGILSKMLVLSNLIITFSLLDNNQ